MTRKTAEAAAGAKDALSPAVLATLLAAFLGASLWLYAPALRGPFLSDDVLYVVHNPYVTELSVANVMAILEPTGPVTSIYGLWAPLHLIAHALEVRAFGSDTHGYHLVNVALHAANSVLFVALLASSRLPLALALFGGAIFLVHPANVEAVAWISQLKSTLALFFALVALLLHTHRPALGSLVFGLGLLSKFAAFAALPFALLREWCRREERADAPQRWVWLVVWSVILAGVGIPVLIAILASAVHPPAGDLAFGTRARTIVAIAARYLFMATTGRGLSTFHQPEPALSPWDPWWLAGAVALVGLGWRSLVVLRRGSEEVAYWAFAVASFAPISQVFPTIYSMSDRYLYFMLPGLIGGGLLAAREAAHRLSDRFEALRRAATASVAKGAAAAAAACLVLGLALQTPARARVFGSTVLFNQDAVLHYPNGLQASMLKAGQAAAAGDAEAAALAIERAFEKGFTDFESVVSSPVFAPLLGHPRFRASVGRIAAYSIERWSGLERPTQHQLIWLARAHAVRDEADRAVAALQRALRVGGPFDEMIRQDLANLASGSGAEAAAPRGDASAPR